MKHCKKILIATLLSATAFSAHALETTIDFEGQTSLGGLNTEASLTIGDVTFEAFDLSGGSSTLYFDNVGTDPDFSGNYLSNGGLGFKNLTFSFATPVTSLEFNLGNNQNDWELTGFDTSGNIIQSLLIDRLPSGVYSNNGTTFGFGLTELSSELSYATLIQGAGPGVAAFSDPIEFDNLKYTTAAIAPVPEPSTYALMLGGLGLVGFMAYRRRKTVNA